MSKTIIIRFHETGEPDVLKYEEVDLPEPGEGELRLEVEAIGIGFGECLYRRGLYIQDTVLPSSLGNHTVGVVDAVGSGVTNVKVGERISLIPSFYMNRYWVYGQHAIVPAFAAAPYFNSLSLEENAALWMQVTTAYGALVHYGNVSSDDTVLVIPASGGVGMAALQTIKKAGGTSIGTTRSREKAEMIRKFGADHVIATSEEDLATRVNQITDGRGVSIAFNALTGPVLEEIANVTAPGGTIFQYGGIQGQETPYPLATAVKNGLKIQGYSLYEMTYNPANLPAVRDYVTQGVKEGHYTANVGKVFRFDEMVEAHRYLEAGSTTGSVVVLVK